MCNIVQKRQKKEPKGQEHDQATHSATAESLASKKCARGSQVKVHAQPDSFSNQDQVVHNHKARQCIPFAFIAVACLRVCDHLSVTLHWAVCVSIESGTLS